MWWRTGNDTPAPQWVYVCIQFPFIFLCKIGIGGNWIRRTTDISKSSPGFLIPVFLVYIPLAYQIEQWLHRKLRRLNVGFRGSGRTEYFIVFAAAFAIPVLALCAFPLYLALLHALVYIVCGEIVAQNTLKWVITHPLATVYLIAMCKVMVIAGQVVTYRSGWKRGRVARFAGKW